jgi:hypothetical protein
MVFSTDALILADANVNSKPILFWQTHRTRYLPAVENMLEFHVTIIDLLISPCGKI